LRNLLDDNEPLISGLIITESLTPSEIIKALINGKSIKLVKAPSGVNFYLKNNQLYSNKISYLKGLPNMWFNPDIHFEIDVQEN